MQPKRSRSTTGIEVRHSRGCPSRDSRRCTCQPSYRAIIFDTRSKALVRKSFSGKGALSAAKGWRADALTQQAQGKNITPSRITLHELADEWLSAASATPPTVLNRSGHPYKPSMIRSYRQVLSKYVLEDLGGIRLSELRRVDVQALVDRLVGRGLGASTVRNVINGLRVLCRHALERDYVSVNPCANLRLPNDVGKRERAASASEAAELLAVLPDDVRPIYSTAAYSGLRRGELRSLRWKDVDLAGGIISVSASWDDVDGQVEPKSANGKRRVPIVGVLRDELTALKARTGRGDDDFVFGPKTGSPFTPSHVRRIAERAWKAENVKRAEGRPLLQPIGLHELRHTFVSLMHDAGIPLERIGDFVGHSSTYMTDQYRHLIEGAEAEAATKFDEYLARADTRARLEQLDS